MLPPCVRPPPRHPPRALHRAREREIAAGAAGLPGPRNDGSGGRDRRRHSELTERQARRWRTSREGPTRHLNSGRSQSADRIQPRTRPCLIEVV
jgi:hypothetical protein